MHVITISFYFFLPCCDNIVIWTFPSYVSLLPVFHTVSSSMRRNIAPDALFPVDVSTWNCGMTIFMGYITTLWVARRGKVGLYDEWCNILWRVTPLKTPFGLLIRFIYNLTHVITITHNYLLRCVTFTQLTILHFNIPFLTSTHIHTWNKHSVHTSRVCLLSRTYSSHSSLRLN
jgi:hypothetical protein